MKKWIRIISMILALIMTLQYLPVRTSAAQTSAEDPSAGAAVQTPPQAEAEPIPEVQADAPSSGTTGNLSWTVEDGVLTISGTGSMPNYGSNTRTPWYGHAGEITTVVIEAGVTSVGDYAFQYCGNLKTVELPQLLTTLGVQAFGYCTALEEIALPDSLTTINTGAFSNCKALTAVTVPDSVTWLGNYAFTACTALAEIQLPSGIRTIPAGLFSGCSALDGVRIPDSVTSIGSDAFLECAALTGIDIPDGVTSLATSTFLKCSALTDVKLSQKLTSIAAYAFNNCTALKTIELPDTLTTLGNSVFSGCTALESIHIGSKLTSLGINMFQRCSSLKSVTFPEGLTFIPDNTFNGCTALESVSLPDTVTGLGSCAFCDCSSLRELRMPASLVSLGSNALARSGVTEIVLPEGLTTIGEYAFVDCTALESLELPDSVTTMGAYAFSGCSALKAAALPQGMTKVANNLFFNCHAMESLTLADSITTIGSYAFANCTSLREVDLPQSLTSIEQRAFENCKSMETVTMHDNLTQIGSMAFLYCVSLKSVALPDSVTTLGNQVFNGCNSMTQATLSHGLTYLPEGTFYQCYALESIAIPASVKQIGSNAFDGCGALANLELSDGLTTIGSYAFLGCHALAQVRLPDTVTTVDDGAFAMCTGLQELHLSGGMSTIEPYTFQDCTTLGSVEIPASVTNIAYCAFDRCSNLGEVYFPGNVTYIDYNAFTVTERLAFYGYPGSYVQSYANQRGIPFFDIQNPPVTLVLTVTDEQGTPLALGYEVAWYRQGETEPVATGNRLKVTDLASGYRYRVTLGETLSYRYYQPEAVPVPTDCGGPLTLALEPITTVTITGQVTNRDGVGLPATITLTQTYNQRYSKTLTFETDPQGRYTLTVDNVPTEAVFIGPEGFYVFHSTLLNAPADAAVVDAGVSALYPLPSGNRIELTLLGRAAGESGPEEALELTAAADLAFTVYNQSRSTWLDAPVFQDGSLYLSGDFGVGDILTISVTDRSGRYAGQSIQVRLGDGCTASTQLTLVENGCIRISGIGGMALTRVMVFGEDGTLLRTETVSSGFASGHLDEGSYRLILMEQNPYIISVADPAQLEQLGLAAGTDYLLLEAHVQTGTITELHGLQTPVLDLSRLRHTVVTDTYVSVSQTAPAQGQYVLVQLHYQLEAAYGQAASGETVLIDLPEGLTPVDRAVSVDGREADYTVSDGRITVRTGADAARIAFYVLAEELGVQSITVSLQSEEGGLLRLEPLGTGVITVMPAQLTAPEQTCRDTVTVSGNALPGSLVRVYEGTELLAETVANAAGSWYSSVTLRNLLSYQIHDLYAVMEHEQLSEPITTESARVVYDSAALFVRRVSMYNTLGGADRLTIFSYDGTGNTPSYSWSPEYPHFTFFIDFDGDNTAAENVELVVYTKGEDRDVYKAVYSEKAGLWIASATYDDPSNLPVNVGVIYDSHAEAVHGLTVEGTAAFEAYDTASREFMESQLIAGEPTTNGSSHSLALMLEGFPELTRDMTLTELALESYDPAALEGLGYKLFDPDHTGAQTYIKLDIADDTMTLQIADAQEQYALSISAPADFIEPAQAEGAARIALPHDPEAEALKETLGEYADLVGIIPSYQDLITVIYHYQTRDRLISDLREKMGELYQMLYATCPNGSPMVKNQDYWWGELQFWEGQILATNSRWNLNLRKCSDQMANNFIKDLFFRGCGKIIEKLSKIGKLSERGKDCADAFLEELGKLDYWTGLLSEYDLIQGDGWFQDYLKKYDDLFGADPNGVYEDMLKDYDTMMDALNGLHDQMIEDVDCDPPKDNDDKCPEPDKNPYIDPAGYVYEAVESNRLEGVTVTAYYQADESLGAASATKWDAENYDQQNPLTTDANGAYSWFVPFGQWAVKFEKEGYETAWSEWLPVPPPQTEVNMGLISTAAPEVESVNVYPDQIRIVFSQYMKPDTIALSVRCGGKTVAGTLNAVNAEYDPTGTELLATSFVFTPDTLLRSEVTTAITAAVNYAGNAMAAGYTATMQTAVCPEEIAMAATSRLVFGETLDIPVQVLPVEAGANRTLTVTTNAPGLVDVARQTVTTDAEGNAVITVIGTLPTTARITVSLDGTDLTASGTVQVLLQKEEPCAVVTASIPNGSTVAPGTMLELYTATEDAKIYYTLDGTCPCVEDSPSRILYREPIELNEDTFLIAYAVKQGCEDSPTAGFIYKICTHPNTHRKDEQPSSCTADGYTGDLFCQDCGTLVEKGSVIPATGHRWDEGVVTVEPTEEHDGEKLFTCLICGETRTEILPSLEHEHSYESIVTAPTCTEQGYTTHTCRCGDSYVDSYTNALGHEMGRWYTVREATCTEDGLERSDCIRCDHSQERTIEAAGHDYESVVTAPTCTEQGYTTHTCRCGDSYVDSYTDALGHEMGRWYTVREATCTVDGLERSDCVRCDHSQERTIEAVGHDYESVVTEPTCTEQGYTTHTCTVCGDSYVDSYTDALGHSFGDWIVVQNPSASADGLEERTCTRCGHAEQRSIPKLANPFADVKSSDFYYAPVLWALEKGITSGTSADKFSPYESCLRSQVVTFLWRAAGKPAPTSQNNPFVDVKPGDYYYDAVLWAVEKGITTGIDSTHFDPNGVCNRSQVVTFLYRAFEKPPVENAANPFTDVPAKEWYAAPVLWAVQEGITNGLSETTFGPNEVCNRSQVVTFLYRAYN